MLNHSIFTIYLIIFLLSNIGYGYIFSNIFFKDFKNLNFGHFGILGFFTIILLSIFTSYFVRKIQTYYEVDISIDGYGLAGAVWYGAGLGFVFGVKFIRIQEIINYFRR